MGLLNFFVDIPDKKQEPKKEETVTSKPKFNFAPTVDMSQAPAAVIMGQGNEFAQTFTDLMDKTNFPGTDYLEYIQAKNTMGAIPDERSRYSIAFNALAPTGLTKDKLLSTAQQYIDAIDNEITKFGEAYQAQYSQKVDNQNKQIDTKVKQMQDLSEQIAKLNLDIQTMKQQVATDQSTLDGKKHAFEYAGNLQKEQITQEVNKINTYI